MSMTSVGEYFMYNFSNYSLAGDPEDAFRKSCMTGIASSVLRLNISERSSVNEKDSDKGSKER